MFLLDALLLVLLLRLEVSLSVVSAILFTDYCFSLSAFHVMFFAAVISCVIAMKMLLLKSIVVCDL